MPDRTVPTEVNERRAKIVRYTRIAQGPLGVAGVTFATWMLASKAALVAIGGISAVPAIPLVANLALLGGSLMFIREALRAVREKAGTSD